MNRKNSLKDILTRELLIDEYVNKKKTMKTIAKEMKCSSVTIFNYLRKYKIPLVKKSLLIKEFLIEEYINKKKSINDISRELGYSSSTIYTYLKYYNIPIRTISEGKMGRLGCVHTDETKRKLSEMFKPKGIKSSAWKGGEKLSKARSNNKRRLLNFIPLNEQFEGSEAHHIDKEHIVYIPKELHKSIYHSLKIQEKMDRINTLVFCWILGFSYINLMKN